MAIALVINSHMDELYPWPVLGTGGAIGNSLFFLLSGLGLCLSESAVSNSFPLYMAKRVRRIYPPAWVASLLLLIPLALYFRQSDPQAAKAILSQLHTENILEFLRILFYPPTEYWFLDALMIFYVGGYFLLRADSKKPFAVASGLLLACYVAAYAVVRDFSILAVEQEMSIRIPFYAAIFLLGIFIGKNQHLLRNPGWRDVAGALAALCIMYGHKYLMYRGYLSEYQFVEQAVLFPLAFFTLRSAASPRVANFLPKGSLLETVVSITAGATLELYLAHGPVRVAVLGHLPPFPANIVFYVLITYLVALGIHRINLAIASRMVF